MLDALSNLAWADLYATLNVPVILLGLGNVLFILVLIKWHVSNGPFDFRKALIDPATKAISFTRLGILVALWSSTEWGMYLIVTGKFTEWFYAGYMTAWVTYGIFSKNTEAKIAIAGAKRPTHDDAYYDEGPRPS